MWCTLEEPDDSCVVRQRDGLIGPEHFLQIEVLGPKLRALLRVSDGKAEMPDRAKFYFHVRTSQVELIRLYSLHPLRAPRRRSKRFSEVLRFAEYFVSSKLVDVHRIPRLSVVRDDDLAYPNRATPHYPQHF